MCGFVVFLMLFSLVGALVMRVTAAALGLRAHLVLGLGSRLGVKDRPVSAYEFRPIPLWVATHLGDDAVGLRAIAARMSAPLAILLVPVVLVAGLIMFRGVDRPREGGSLVVEHVVPGSAAEVGGIEPGDVVCEVEGRPMTDVESLIGAVQDRGGQATRVVIERAGARRELSIIPLGEGRARLGVATAPQLQRVSIGPLEAMQAVVTGAAQPWWSFLREGGPVIQMMPERTDWLRTVIALGVAWTANAPVVALFAALGQLAQAIRARASARCGVIPRLRAARLKALVCVLATQNPMEIRRAKAEEAAQSP